MSFVKNTLTKAVAIGALSIGAIGGYEANDAFDKMGSSSEYRYPLEVEYALVDSCIKKRSILYRTNDFLKARKKCLCAIETTTKEVSYHQYQNDIAEFENAIRYSVQRCKN